MKLRVNSYASNKAVKIMMVNDADNFNIIHITVVNICSGIMAYICYDEGCKKVNSSITINDIEDISLKFNYATKNTIKSVVASLIKLTENNEIKNYPRNRDDYIKFGEKYKKRTYGGFDDVQITRSDNDPKSNKLINKIIKAFYDKTDRNITIYIRNRIHDCYSTSYVSVIVAKAIAKKYKNIPSYVVIPTVDEMSSSVMTTDTMIAYQYDDDDEPY